MKELDEKKFNKLMEDLRGKLLIVEGKKDKEALKSFGLKNIIAINGRPLYEVAEITQDWNGEIIILTDFDKTGNKLNSKLKMFIGKYGKKMGPGLRRRFRSLGIDNIEDLKNVVDKMGSFESPLSVREDDYHVKVSTNFNKIRNKSSNKRKRSNRKA